MRTALTWLGRAAFIALLVVFLDLVVEVALQVGSDVWDDAKHSMCEDDLNSPEAQAFRWEALVSGDYLARQEAWLADRWYCQ